MLCWVLSLSDRDVGQFQTPNQVEDVTKESVSRSEKGHAERSPQDSRDIFTISHCTKSRALCERLSFRYSRCHAMTRQPRETSKISSLNVRYVHATGAQGIDDVPGGRSRLKDTRELLLTLQVRRYCTLTCSLVFEAKRSASSKPEPLSFGRSSLRPKRNADRIAFRSTTRSVRQTGLVYFGGAVDTS